MGGFQRISGKRRSARTSWPTGYSNLEYRDGDYRYPAQQAPRPANYGEHPYATFSADGYGDAGGYPGSSANFGYGDPGYSDSGYDGPASQDAGIASTRTVRGYVEAPPARTTRCRARVCRAGIRRARSNRAGLPAAAPRAGGLLRDYNAADTYRQPWNYDQPLRYEGDEQAVNGYGQQGSYQDADGYGRDSHGQRDYRQDAYSPQEYTSADYNGSELSRPGIDGPGYDLSGIIGTGDFEAVGYDDPSYGRLSYDDPRYDDPRYAGPAADTGRDDTPGARFDETRYDMPASMTPGWTACGSRTRMSGKTSPSGTETMASEQTARSVPDTQTVDSTAGRIGRDSCPRRARAATGWTRRGTTCGPPTCGWITRGSTSPPTMRRASITCASCPTSAGPGPACSRPPSASR